MMMMDSSKLQQSKLFKYTSVDTRDEFEEKYERAYQNLQQKIFGLNDQELHDLLSGLICKDKQHEDVSMGLIYQILVEPTLAQKTYRDLTFLTRDGLMYVTTNLSILVVEKYLKLKDVPKRQLIWLLRELVKNQVLNVDNIMWNALRQASGGDVSAKNLLLIDNLLDILMEHRPWLDKYPFLVGAVVYTYVRLIEDHSGPALAELRQKEVKFVIALIRDRFHDVIPLGRDFVRLLQNVARIPEFEQLWRDILSNPKALLPTFTGVWQLLQIRTSRRFLQCRLTPDVERKLHFLMGSVKFGTHKRYQDWFQDKYFTTSESHSLRADLIRFIINAIHPTNDMLCSDLIPRWAIIGWLLTSCTNPIALANAKLALFYDWLFFDPIKDNIMNIEPGILVMYHSIRNHPMVSSTLLDFLCRIMKNFDPIHEELVRNGIHNSFRKILEKQVIPNLYPLFESPKLDRELKFTLRECFREFFVGVGTSATSTTGTGTGTILQNIDNNNLSMMSPDSTIMNSNQSSYHHHHHNNNFDENRLIGIGTGGGGGGLLLQQQQINALQNNDLEKCVGGIAEGNLIDSILNSSSMGGFNSNTTPVTASAIAASVAFATVVATHPTNTTTTTTAVAADAAAAAAATVTSVVDDELGENELEAEFSDDDDEKLKINLIKNEETDDDDDIPLSKVRLKESKPLIEKVELPTSIAGSFEICLMEKTAVTFDTFFNDYRMANASLDDEQETYLQMQLVNVIKKTLPKISELFPESKGDDKSLAENINYPIFSIFKVIYQYEDKCKKCLAHLIKQLLNKLHTNEQPQQQNQQDQLLQQHPSHPNHIGYLLLYFLKIYTKMQSRKNVNACINYKINVYKIYCDHLDTKIEMRLTKDLTELERECTQIFLWLLPDIFREFKTIMINNRDVLQILCGCVDAKNLRDIIFSVTQGKLVLLKNDGIIECVRHSLNYETFEQYCLWQLVQAHDIPLEFLQDILPELESSNHAEAITYMLFILKNEKPTTELVRLLLSRETKGRSDQFVTSSLRYWCKHSEETLSELIANLLTSKYPNSSPNKRKRPSKGNSTQNSTPSSDQLLAHLEYFRRSCRHGNGTGTGLYVQDAMQRALQQAFGHSSDSTKKQYSDLFALAAEDDTSGVGRRGTGGRGRKAPQNNKGQTGANSSGGGGGGGNKKTSAAANTTNDSSLNYSTDEDSSEDDWSKPKSSKRRKKQAAISDSD